MPSLHIQDHIAIESLPHSDIRDIIAYYPEKCNGYRKKITDPQTDLISAAGTGEWMNRGVFISSNSEVNAIIGNKRCIYFRNAFHISSLCHNQRLQIHAVGLTAELRQYIAGEVS